MNSFEQNEERIKADINEVIQSVSGGQQPDMEKLKQAGSDILNATASMLSNSGIAGLTGSGSLGSGSLGSGPSGSETLSSGTTAGPTGGGGLSGMLGDLMGHGGAGPLAGGGASGTEDGAAAAAGGILKKLRDGLGLNANALDEIRHAADQLKNNL